MCGRYTFQHAEALRRLIEGITGEKYDSLMARYNVAPTQNMPVVLDAKNWSDYQVNQHIEGTAPHPRVVEMHWGTQILVDEGRPQLSINARSERATYTRFKDALQKRRCLIPACGFYEWDRSTKPASPFMFSLPDKPAFWMAGIWEGATDEFVAGYLVLTTEPNTLVSPIHDRMPAILTPEAAQRWITPGPITKDDVASICSSYDASQMASMRVNPIVNNARNDVPECVAPAAEFMSGDFFLS